MYIGAYILTWGWTILSVAAHILLESRKEALSFRQALKIVIVNPREVPEFLIPSLDVVDKDILKKREQE